MPQGPRQLEQNAQTLQQARGGRTPEEMARILGVARDALGDFANNIYDWFAPQDATDVAAELAPFGKLVSPMLKAGLPFAAYRPMLKGIPGGVGHGTTVLDKVVAEGVDKSRFDVRDVLGWLFHAAEDPEYFNQYADGFKRTAGVSKIGVLPLAPEAQNVLDLVDPSLDDIGKAIAPVTGVEREYILNAYKEARRYKEALDTELQKIPEYDAKELAQRIRDENWIRSDHVPVAENLTDISNDPVYQRLPAFKIAERLRLTPEQFAQTDFDAIRYNDMDKKSWAFDVDRVPLKTVIGTEVPVKRQPLPKRETFRVGPEGDINTPLTEHYEMLKVHPDAMSEIRAMGQKARREKKQLSQQMAAARAKEENAFYSDKSQMDINREVRWAISDSKKNNGLSPEARFYRILDYPETSHRAFDFANEWAIQTGKPLNIDQQYLDLFYPNAQKALVPLGMTPEQVMKKIVMEK